jgi:hypothetical protein
MKRWKSITLRVYLVGVVVFALMLFWHDYDGGAFQRSHTAAGLAISAFVHIAASLLWPVVITMLFLQIIGVLPRLM